MKLMFFPKRKALLVAVVSSAIVACFNSISAIAGLTGDEVILTYGDIGESTIGAFTDWSVLGTTNPAGPRVVGSASPLFPSGAFNVDVQDSTVTVAIPQGDNDEEVLGLTTYPNATFAGLVLDDLNQEFATATLQSMTGVTVADGGPPFSAGNIFISGGDLWINLLGTDWAADSSLVVQVTAAPIPEPDSFILAGALLVAAQMVCCRRKITVRAA